MSKQPKQARRLSHFDKNSAMVICEKYADDRDLLFCCMGKGGNGWSASFLDRELYIILYPIIRKRGVLGIGGESTRFKVESHRTKGVFTNDYERTMKFWDSVPEHVTIRKFGRNGEVKVR